MALLFISCLIPERKEYYTPAFARSAQNVVTGIADELYKYDDVELISCPPLSSFPKGVFWQSARSETLSNGQILHVWPALNLPLIKSIFWGIYSLYYIPKWAKKHKDENRRVLCYNIFLPPVSFIYWSCKKASSKLFLILMDLGVPSKQLKLTTMKMWAFKFCDRMAHKYIPKVDGRIIINERMSDCYAPGKDYILIDGGVNKEIIKRLFPLTISKSKTLTCVLAGLLWAQNGTQLVLEMLRKYPDLDVKLIFAGVGNDVPLLESMSSKDKRVEYVGYLSQDELFKYYQEADVLLNIRIEESCDMYFPSKLLEYMAIGKLVISTPVAHAERDYGEYLEILQDQTPDGLAKLLRNISCRPYFEILEKGIKSRQFMLNERTWEFRTKEIVGYMNSRTK